VPTRSWLIIALCLVLASVRVAGTHVHFVHSHTAGSPIEAHHVVVMAEEDSPLHLKSHLSHGDVDADDSAQTTAKVSFLATVFAPALILLAFLVLVEPPFTLRVRAQRPELRPPRRRSVYDLTPPSHAPPVAP